MKTVTYNPLTHKIVPINPTYEMVTAWHDSVFNYEDDDENVAKSISNVIAAAPEYQESELPAPDGDDHIGDANKMVKTAHVCAFSRSVLDGYTETCSCGAWR